MVVKQWDFLEQKGASLERQVWMAKVRRLIKQNRVGQVAEGYALEALIAFGRKREKRTRSRKGGL